MIPSRGFPVLLLLLPTLTTSFGSPAVTRPRTSSLGLVPLIQFQDDLTFFDDRQGCIGADGTLDNNFVLGLPEQADLPDLARFIIEAFGADAIRLSQDVNAFERMLMQPAVEFMNGYSGLVAFAEVLVGLQDRLEDRLDSPDIDRPGDGMKLTPEQGMDLASRSSVVLMLASNDEIIGSVEVRMEPADAKIPFTLPWLDKVERRLGKIIGLDRPPNLQPYLGNLCVAEKYRGRGIGRALVRCVEDIAKTAWGCSHIYLHVDEENTSALELYRSEGYQDVGVRWNPFWAGKASEIGYFVKNLSDNKSKRHAENRHEVVA